MFLGVLKHFQTFSLVSSGSYMFLKVVKRSLKFPEGSAAFSDVVRCSKAF